VHSEYAIEKFKLEQNASLFFGTVVNPHLIFQIRVSLKATADVEKYTVISFP
jgi:nitrogen regulatory protein PII-like uncharacterized protein